MASVSVYRSYAKCVLDTKTLILPTQDNGWLFAPPTELCNYQQQQQQNFINKKINLKKYCPQLARLFEAGQCVQNTRIETKAINYHSQQGPDSAQLLGQIKNKVLASQNL